MVYAESLRSLGHYKCDRNDPRTSSVVLISSRLIEYDGFSGQSTARVRSAPSIPRFQRVCMGPLGPGRPTGNRKSSHWKGCSASCAGRDQVRFISESVFDTKFILRFNYWCPTKTWKSHFLKLVRIVRRIGEKKKFNGKMQACPVPGEGATPCHHDHLPFWDGLQPMFHRKSPGVVILANYGEEIPARDDELHIVRSLCNFHPLFIQTQLPEHTIRHPMGRSETFWRARSWRIL